MRLYGLKKKYSHSASMLFPTNKQAILGSKKETCRCGDTTNVKQKLADAAILQTFNRNLQMRRYYKRLTETCRCGDTTNVQQNK